MSAIEGSASDPRSPWGVLGTGTPTQFPQQDSPPAIVPAVGVEGVASDSPDSIAAFLQGFGDEPIVQAGAGAGVLGVRLGAPTQPGDSPVESFGFLAGRSPFAGEVTGAFGQASQRGVIGIAGAGGIGVYGGSIGGTGTGVFGDAGDNNVGVHGRSNGPSGVGVRAENSGSGLAAHIVGDVKIEGRVIDDLRCAGDVFLENGDICERFAVGSDQGACMAGTVMVIGENGTLVPCSRRYDTRVIGVVSGGGSLKPAMTLKYNSFLSPSVVVALVGTVYCLADASYGTISPGDVLVASDTVGHAMRATEPDRPGAMIGKALAPLLEGRGLIPIIVALR